MNSSWDSIDRYVVISSDTHAGADRQEYKAYLPPRWHEEFDAWAAAYVSPWDDLVSKTAVRNWDSDLRVKELEQDGVVAEVTFPNTIPPFFPTVGTIADLPRDRAEYERRWAGIQAHNRWLVDFCAQAPGRRRGLAQIFPNDIDHAVGEIRWAAETGAICGILLPAVPPNHEVAPLFSDVYEPIWATCEEVGLSINQHSGTGGPDLPYDQPATGAVMMYEFGIWTRRTLWHLILAGVFDRHPDLKFVMTEQGGPTWFANVLVTLDGAVKRMKGAPEGRTERLFSEAAMARLSMLPSEYFARNCYVGASFMHRDEVESRHAVGVDRIMWGTDYPHEEGTTPFTREALRRTFADVPVEECRAMLGGTAAQVYGFDLDFLAGIAAEVGPRVDEVHTPLDRIPEGATSVAFTEVAIGATY